MSDETPESPAGQPAEPTPPPGAPVPPPGAPVPPPGAPVPPPGTPIPSAGVPATFASTADNTMGVLALIAGILGFTCIPFVGAVLAIIFGRIGVKKAEQGLATNAGMARVGFWLGVISLVFTAIGVLIVIILSIVAAISGVDGGCGVGTNTPCNV